MHQTRYDADSYQRVEVITGLRRRRDWSDAEKARILAESADPEVNISEVARRNGVSRGLLNVWRRKARLATIEGPPFVQIRLDDGAEAPPDAIRAVRQAETKPLMEALKARLEAVKDGISRQSTLIKAIDYMLERWEGLTAFLNDGRLEPDTNTVER